MLFGRTLWSAFQGMHRIAGLFRDVSPVMTADERAMLVSGQRIHDEIEVIRDRLDTRFYLETYPDVREAGVDPVEHYCLFGWQEGRDPRADFSTSFYLTTHPDVDSSGINPFWHYVVAGIGEGRSIARTEDIDADPKKPLYSAEMRVIETHFDPAFYGSKYGDVTANGTDPIEHYCSIGWKEGRDPSAVFSTTFYLEANPDVADAGVNPFWHYIVAGKGEGRSAQHPGGYRVDLLRHRVTLDKQVRHWTHNRVPGRLLNHEEIADAVRKLRKEGGIRLLLSIGHDNYHKVSGGVQLCEYREEALSGTNGCVYLSLHPWQPLPRLAHPEDRQDPLLSLLAGGDNLGECRTSDLLRAVTALVPEFDDTQVVIHQLLGHMPEHIRDLILAAGRRECWFWLHDFLTICPSFTLQRNSVSYCGAPPLNSNACTLCCFGPERQTHSVRMRSFFKDIDVHVLAPSQVAADIWQGRSGLKPASLRVLPHMQLEWRKRPRPRPRESGPMTIGFLGTPTPQKGWNIFETLYRNLSPSGNFRFVYFGLLDLPATGMDHRPVHVTANDPEAMMRAVKEEKIDLVLHWSSCPETFSLSTHEAYAGGAYVITNEVSGNVAATVRRLGRGAVLPDEHALQAFFSEGRAAELVQDLREERRRYDVEHRVSHLVHDAIDLAAAEDRR